MVSTGWEVWEHHLGPQEKVRVETLCGLTWQGQAAAWRSAVAGSRAGGDRWKTWLQERHVPVSLQAIARTF